MKPISKLSAWVGLVVLWPLEAGAFCLYWNVLDTHGAVGLGTVNFWTAMGVDATASSIVAALVAGAYSSVRTMKKYRDALD